MIGDPRTKHFLRCFCSRQPLLATYGLDSQRKVYVHVKVYKQKRIYGNILILSGIAAFQCRECLRWHRVHIVERTTTPKFDEVQGVALSDDDVLAAVDSGRPTRATSKVGDRDD